MLVGRYGTGWSSTVSDSNGINLRFDMTWLSSGFAYYRGYGLQLRCLSE